MKVERWETMPRRAMLVGADCRAWSVVEQKLAELNFDVSRHASLASANHDLETGKPFAFVGVTDAEEAQQFVTAVRKRDLGARILKASTSTVAGDKADLVLDPHDKAGTVGSLVQSLLIEYLYPRTIADILEKACKSVLNEAFAMGTSPKGSLELKASPKPMGEVVSLVTFLGEAVSGCLAIGASADCLLRVHEKTIGKVVDRPLEAAKSVAGEMANQISAKFKTAMLTHKVNLRCGFPVVVEGLQMSLTYRPGRIGLVQHFGGPIGELDAELCLDVFDLKLLESRTEVKTLGSGQVTFF